MLKNKLFKVFMPLVLVMSFVMAFPLMANTVLSEGYQFHVDTDFGVVTIEVSQFEIVDGVVDMEFVAIGLAYAEHLCCGDMDVSIVTYRAYNSAGQHVGWFDINKCNSCGVTWPI